MVGGALERTPETTTLDPCIIVFYTLNLPRIGLEQRRTAHLAGLDGLYKYNVWIWRVSSASKRIMLGSWSAYPI